MDTPGLFDSAQPYEDTAAEVVRCLTDLDPGPHAVLYVVSISQKYTKEDFRTYSRLKNLLGQDITGRMIIILTHGDELEDGEVTVEEYIENVPTEFHTVLAECHQRYVVFNNKSPAVRAQQSALIRKVQQLGGGHHTNPYSGLTPSQVKEEVRRRVYRSFQAEAQASNYVCQLEQDVLDTQMATQRAREDLQKARQQLEAEKREAEKERKANGRGKRRYFSSKCLCRMFKVIAGIGVAYFVIYSLSPDAAAACPVMLSVLPDLFKQGARNLFSGISDGKNSSNII